MKLADFLLFPKEKTVYGDGLSITLYGNDEVDDPDVLEILDMLVAADSVDEVRMVLTVGFRRWCERNGGYGLVWRE
jgi:hypothetical protein